MKHGSIRRCIITNFKFLTSLLYLTIPEDNIDLHMAYGPHQYQMGKIAFHSANHK